MQAARPLRLQRLARTALAQPSAASSSSSSKAAFSAASSSSLPLTAATPRTHLHPSNPMFARVARKHTLAAARATQPQTFTQTRALSSSQPGQYATHAEGAYKVRAGSSPPAAPAQRTAEAAPGPAASTSRLQAPIPLTGLFAERGIAHADSTPAIGTEFARGSLDLAAVLAHDSEDNDALLRELASMVAHRGVVFFRGQHSLTPQLLHKLADKLGRLSGRPASSGLHIHPLSKEFSESGEFKGERISSEADAEGRQISFPDEKSELASTGWHADISFERAPSDYAMLQIRTLPPTGGDTLWASMYAAYDALSPAMQRFVEGLTATHDAEMFRVQAARHGFPLYAGPRGSPDNTGDALRAVHPVVRTNPVTGWKGLYINRAFTRRINELTMDESASLLAYLFRHVAENYNHHVRFKWERDDLAIWCNRSTQHSGIFDIGKQRRDGDRCCSIGERPFFDPTSKSRAEQLGL